MKKIYLLLTAIVFLIAVKSTSAQNPSLVYDINQTGDIPSVYQFSADAVSNGILYFQGTNDFNEDFLWHCDGTTAGTYPLISMTIDDAADYNGTLLLSASSNTNNSGRELWKSDGTATGTVIVKDIVPGSVSSYPYFMGAVNNHFIFSTDLQSLWKTDGTEAGTILLKVVDVGGSSALLNGNMLFDGGSVAEGIGIWATDGTPAGTNIIKQVSFNNNLNGTEAHLVNFSNSVYFAAYDDLHGFDLWKTNGTAAGTKYVSNFGVPFAMYPTITAIKVCNGKLLILYEHPFYGAELWVSDGTLVGTQLLKDIGPGTTGGNISNLTVIGNAAYFTANDGVHGTEPWITDATTSGTVMITDLNPGTPGSTVYSFSLAGSQVVFNASTFINNISNIGIWKTDGTAGGTTQIYAQCCGLTSKSMEYNGEVYYGSINTKGLWVTDGTAAGSSQFPIAVSQTNSSIPSNSGSSFKMFKFNDHQYILLADDGVHGSDPWITDGTPSGTYLLKDFSQAVGAYYAFSKPVNGKIFFWVNNSAIDDGFWVTDGTAAGTVQLKNSLTTIFPDCAVVNGILYFTSTPIGSNTYGLYRSDGTIAGTYSITPGNLLSASHLATLNNEIYFDGKDIEHGGELWKSDGTLAGTSLLKDCLPGDFGFDPAYLTVYKNRIYFASPFTIVNSEVWVTDGTAAGTQIFKDINPGNKSSRPSQFTVSGNTLYFSATYLETGYELWKSDGTPVGTSQVKDIYPGKKNGLLGSLVDVNGTLYFFGNDSVYGGELWKSDGTAAGTLLVKDISPGKQTSNLDNLTNLNGDAYFMYVQLSSMGQPEIRELWRSDGTACHTQPIDMNPGEEDQLYFLTADGNAIFIYRPTVQYNFEPWKYLTSPITSFEICNGIDDDCNGIIDDNALAATITPSGNINACDGELVTLNANPTGDELNYAWYYNGTLINGVTTPSLSSATLGGSIEVVINSSFGCTDTSDATTVTRIPLPKAKVTPQGDLDICTTGSVILKASAASTYSYQWLLNNVAIPGATKKNYTATVAGNYKVEVMNTDGCTKTSKKTSIFTSCKYATQNIDVVSTLRLYPNPTNGLFTAKFSSPETSSTPATITITDVLGRKIMLDQYPDLNSINNQPFQLDNHSPNGLYFFEIRTTDNISQQPFTLQR